MRSEHLGILRGLDEASLVPPGIPGRTVAHRLEVIDHEVEGFFGCQAQVHLETVAGEDRSVLPGLIVDMDEPGAGDHNTVPGT